MNRNHPMGFSYLEQRYPTLARRIARLPLGDFPTPLQRLGHTEQKLWVKRDDQTHSVYGGNKIRKLEYLLARAREQHCKQVVTFGGVGSNHALATAIHARANDLGCVSLLLPQRMTDYVQGTLVRHQANHSELRATPMRRANRLRLMRELRDRNDRRLAVVPMGGTSPRGSIGYVNAAFELAAQWHGSQPPQRIYVAAGTMGTVAGLAVGLSLLGWPTTIMAVRVVVASQCNDIAMQRLCEKTSLLLNRYDSRIPRIDDAAARITIRGEYLGADYADTTQASCDAVDEAIKRWSLPLETTYTGKAMACMLDDLQQTSQRGDWMFWHTYNGRAAGSQPIDLASPYADFLSLCA
ncbi:MAG: pyridoxal-phosphate dependent enzyme [Pseudomonadota bacterium]